MISSGPEISHAPALRARWRGGRMSALGGSVAPCGRIVRRVHPALAQVGTG